MDGLPLNIDRGHTSGGEDGKAFPGGGTEVLEQRGFPGAGPSGEKDVLLGVVEEP